MLGGAWTGGDFAHPARLAMTATNANAVAILTKESGRSVVRGNFAADQFDLLRPRIGLRNWPQYKLVETLRNVFTQARDYIVRRTINRALEVRLRAAAHSSEHRAHFFERAFARRRDATEQDQSRFDVCVG